MPLYDVLKTLDLGKRAPRRFYYRGDILDIDARRAEWLMKQHQAIAPHNADGALPALVRAKPNLASGCCGRR